MNRLALDKRKVGGSSPLAGTIGGTMFVYKIKRLDGLFSTGGCTPEFTKTGKTWSSIGHVKTHLRQFYNSFSKKWHLPKDYKDAEMCCYELSPTLSSAVRIQRMQESLEKY